MTLARKMADIRETETSKLAFAQYVLTAAIALVTGIWGLVTYTNEQARLTSEKAESIATAKRRAVEAMSRQLGLMDAQCPGTALIELGERDHPTLLEKACFDAYIEAEALFFFTRTQLTRPCELSDGDWSNLWSGFKGALEKAGDSEYVPSDIEVSWNNIVYATHEGRSQQTCDG